MDYLHHLEFKINLLNEVIELFHWLDVVNSFVEKRDFYIRVLKKLMKVIKKQNDEYTQEENNKVYFRYNL